MDPLTIPGKLESLKEIRSYIRKAAEIAELDNMVTYRLNLAVDEIATNIVVHGYDEAGLEGDIQVSAEIYSETLKIFLVDNGAAYDSTAHETKDESLEQPLEQRPIGGLGVYLAIKNVDKFVYTREDNQNKHIFVVNRKTNPETSGEEPI